MKFLTLVLGLVLGIQVNLYAQGFNLVTNPGFENFEGCPYVHGTLAAHMNNWWGYSTDFFNACAETDPELGIPYIGVPINIFGIQEPRSGSSYGGIFAFNPIDYDQTADRYEYMITKLSSPLNQGIEYRASFYWSASEFSGVRLASNGVFGLGLYFSADYFDTDETNGGTGLINDGLTVIPQVVAGDNEFLLSTEGWTKAESSFVAQESEEYLIFGYFNPAPVERVDYIYQTSPLTMWGPTSYYYVDDISVSCQSSPQIVFHSDAGPGITEFRCHELPVIDGTQSSNFVSYRWIIDEVNSDGEVVTSAVRAWEGSGNPGIIDLDNIEPKLPKGKYKVSLFTSCHNPYEDMTSKNFEVLDDSELHWTATPNPTYLNEYVEFNNDTFLSGNMSVTWDFGDGLVYEGTDNFSQSWSEVGDYPVTLTVSNEYCSLSDTQNIRVLDKNEIFVPNAFTPNGDRHNQVFAPEGTFFHYTLRISNRWGTLLYVGENHGWDGRFKGKEMPEDLYVYEIEYTKQTHLAERPNTKKPIHGFVKLIR